MSAPTTTNYANLEDVKRRLNIPQDSTVSDEKIGVALREADAFVNVQIGVHRTTPLRNPDPQIISLAGGYASALFNLWQSPSKEPLLELVKLYKKDIGDHIKAVYAGEDITGHTGGTFTSTSGITGLGSTRTT